MTSVAAMAAGRYDHKRSQLFSKDFLSKRGSMRFVLYRPPISKRFELFRLFVMNIQKIRTS